MNGSLTTFYAKVGECTLISVPVHSNKPLQTSLQKNIRHSQIILSGIYCLNTQIPTKNMQE